MPASASPGGPGGPGGAEGTASLKKKIFFKLAAVFYFLFFFSRGLGVGLA